MNPVTLVHEAHITHENMVVVFSVVARPLAGYVFLCWRGSFIVDAYWLLFVLRSHNTKTTTWLDPRLAKKAKPPEKCEDGGTVYM